MSGVPRTTTINHAGRDVVVWVKSGMAADEALFRAGRQHRLSSDEAFILRRSINDLLQADRVREVRLLAL